MRHVLLIAFWGALVFAFVMALLPKPPQLPGDPGDKVQHIAAFAVLTALASAAYPAASVLRIAIWLAAFGLIIEVCQLIPTLHRDGSALDWAADVGAVLVVLGIVHWVRKLKMPHA